MDLDYIDDTSYPNLQFDPEEQKQDLTNIYDFIERGFARESPSMFLRFEQDKKMKKCFFLVSEDKKEFRLFDGKTEELYLFATYDDFDEHFLIYSYDKEETAFNFSSPSFKLQMFPSKNHFVLWNYNCEKCDLFYKKYCLGIYQKIRQQLMFVEHFKKEMEDYKIHMLRVIIPNQDEQQQRKVWCPMTEKIGKRSDNYNKEFHFRSVDWKMVENKEIPNDTIYIRTRFPDWNEETKSYIIDFNGRVKRKSTKNYQLMIGNDESKNVMFQFGKYQEKTYILDYMGPLCMIQAFALGLVTFNWKTV